MQLLQWLLVRPAAVLNYLRPPNYPEVFSVVHLLSADPLLFQQRKYNSLKADETDLLLFVARASSQSHYDSRVV